MRVLMHHIGNSIWLPLAVVAALSVSGHAQEGSDEFDRSGVLGRVFSTTSFQDQLVIGGYKSLQADNQYFGLVATFDGSMWQALGSGIPSGGAIIDYDVPRNPKLERKGMLVVYNPLTISVTRTLRPNLYYTGLADTAQARDQRGVEQSLTLDRAFTVAIDVTVPAQGMNWYVFE